MPIAGLAGHDVVQNFTKCTMKGFHDYAGFIMDPLMGEFAIVNDTLSEVGSAMSSMRGMMGTVRGGFLGIIDTVFGKIGNLMSQFQYIIIRMRTVMSRLVGIMMTFVAVFTTGGQSAESVMNGPIMKTISFLCFDPETKVRVWQGKDVKITDLLLGDRLFDGSRVTSLYQFLGKGVDMYSLNGVRVSGEHKVQDLKGKFIKVKDHKLAKKTTECETLVCINTSTNKIHTRFNIFLDFDEVDNFVFSNFKNAYISSLYGMKKVTRGFTKTGVFQETAIPLRTGTKTINNIAPGDILDNGEKITGIAVHSITDKTYYSLNGVVGTGTTLCFKNDEVFAYQNIADECSVEPTQKFIVYQLITESSTFPVLDRSGNRVQMIDELQTTEKFISEIKDRMIVSH
jgi:hypothetical protein